MADSPSAAASAAALSPTEARVRVGQQEEEIRHLLDELAEKEAENTRLRADNVDPTDNGRVDDSRRGWGGFVRGLVLAIILILLIFGAGFVTGAPFGLRLQADCFAFDYLGRTQYVCFTADGLRFTEVPSKVGAETDDALVVPDGVTTLVDPTAADADTDSVPAELVRINGAPVSTEVPICTPVKEEIQPECVAVKKDDPCDLVFTDDLRSYFDYRQWDERHIAIILEELKGEPDEDSLVHYTDYEFWGDDGPNLRAFIRDQRFGLLDTETYVVYASQTVRYTIFRCECGITAIYREIRIIYKPPPKKRRPPPDDVPGARCIDSNKACI